MPRLEFTSETKRAAYQRSRGVCECARIPFLRRPNGCGIVLGAGNVFYEHVIPDNIRPDNSLDNCAVLCRTCWREKTAKYDRPTIAKSNHSRDRNRGIKPVSRCNPLAGTVASGWKKSFNGGWERR